ncbi:unnamed protein product [Parnassius apollo]|uniref:(apollo) hypothetical protein n=1 Tax=Parnassius apollo TaxID=110799 RepID=A0A8S3X9B4_PARAO|nr:unnamed protein product [Parnassius apollo]
MCATMRRVCALLGETHCCDQLQHVLVPANACAARVVSAVQERTYSVHGAASEVVYSICAEVMYSECVEIVYSVCAEDVYFVCAEVVYSVYAEVVYSVCVEVVYSVCVEVVFPEHASGSVLAGTILVQVFNMVHVVNV